MPRVSQGDSVNKNWKLFNKYYILVMAVSVLTGFCAFFINNTLSLHIDSLGAGAATTGYLSFGYSIAAILSKTFSGGLSDRTSRRRIMTLGIIIYLASCFACGFAESVGLLMLTRVVQGIGSGMSMTCVTAAVADVVPPERMGEGIGLFGLGSSLTQAVGPAIALALFERGGFLLVCMGTTVCLAVALVVMIFIGYERDASFPGNRLNRPVAAKQRKSIGALFEKKALPAASVQLLASMSYSALVLYLMLFATRTGIENAGLFFTCAAVTTVLARLITGRLTDRKGPLVTILIGFCFGLLMYAFLFACVQVHWMFYISGLCWGFFSGLTMPALNTVAMKAAAPERKGAAASTYSMTNEIATLFGSLTWGNILDATSFEVVFTISSVLIILGMVLSVVLFRRRKAQ